MVPMNMPPLDPVRDYLRELDTSIAESVREMKAGGGVDMDVAYAALCAELEMAGRHTR